MLNLILLQIGTKLADASKPVDQAIQSGSLMSELFQTALKSSLVMVPLLFLTLVAVFIFLNATLLFIKQDALIQS